MGLHALGLCGLAAHSGFFGVVTADAGGLDLDLGPFFIDAGTVPPKGQHPIAGL